MWDAHPGKCRQLAGIGKLIGEKLLAAGLGDLQSLLNADPRAVERAAHKAYPWGDERQADIRQMIPAPCSIDVSLQGTAAAHDAAPLRHNPVLRTAACDNCMPPYMTNTFTCSTIHASLASAESAVKVKMCSQQVHSTCHRIYKCTCRVQALHASEASSLFA
jgi:hypothetical protein